MYSKINILNLPEEILYKIFLDLEFSDKKIAALVCKRFLNISNSRALMKNILIRVLGESFHDILRDSRFASMDPVDLFSNTERPYSKIFFGYECLDATKPLQILKNISWSLTTLTLCYIKISDTTFVELLLHLNNLEELTLNYVCTVRWQPAVFENIVCLKVRRFKWECFLMEEIMFALISAMPHLECVKHTTVSVNVSEDIKGLTSVGLQEILNSKAGTLKSLGLREIELHSKFFETRMPLKLDILELEEVDISVNQLNQFLESQTTLSNLSLQYCCLDSKTLQIISKLPLQSLCLNQPKDNSIEDVDLAPLKSIKSLKKLYLSSLPLTDQGFNLGFMHLNFQNLTTLVLIELEYISASVFERIINGTCNLQFLVSISNPKLLTNNNLQLIFQKSLNLQLVGLTDSKKITDAGFSGTFSISRLKNLHGFALDNLVNVTDKTAASIVNNTLKTLTVCNCPKITVNGMKAMILQCPMLEEVRILAMPQIPKDDIENFCKANLKRFKLLMFYLNTDQTDIREHASLSGMLNEFNFF